MVRCAGMTADKVVVNGEVIYSNPGRGVGVRFHGLSTADRAMLELELGKV